MHLRSVGLRPEVGVSLDAFRTVRARSLCWRGHQRPWSLRASAVPSDDSLALQHVEFTGNTEDGDCHCAVYTCVASSQFGVSRKRPPEEASPRASRPSRWTRQPDVQIFEARRRRGARARARAAAERTAWAESRQVWTLHVVGALLVHFLSVTSHVLAIAQRNPQSDDHNYYFRQNRSTSSIAPHTVRLRGCPLAGREGAEQLGGAATSGGP